MASVSAFNDMLMNFLSELKKCLPDEKGIDKAMTAVDIMKSANARKVVEVFMTGIGPLTQKIQQQDESAIADLASVEGLKDIDFVGNWGSLSVGTKNAIWQYLQTLTLLGGVLTSLPADTMSVIDNVAKECVDSLEGGDLKESDLMGAVGKMMHSLGFDLGGRK